MKFKASSSDKRCGNPKIGGLATISSNLRCSFFLVDASRGLFPFPTLVGIWSKIRKVHPFTTFVILWFTFTLFVKSWKLSKNSLCPFQAINDGRWGVTYVVVVFILVWLVWERMYQVVVLVKMWRLFGCSFQIVGRSVCDRRPDEKKKPCLSMHS